MYFYDDVKTHFIIIFLPLLFCYSCKEKIFYKKTYYLLSYYIIFMTYQIILYIHSWLRWLGLLLLIFQVLKSFFSWITKRKYLRKDKIFTSVLVGLLDIQLVLGIGLYFFLSPISMKGLENIGEAMKDSTTRFWTVEHFSMMLVAIVLAHIGKIKIQKEMADPRKFKLQALYFFACLLLIIAGIPFERWIVR